MKFDEILEACWKGYHKEGMKTMFGKRYPNCVKNKKKSNEDIDQQGVAEGKRVARKPGQPAGSKKHSDLYTDENPRGTITGLKFATVADARASVTKIRGSGRSHAHKIQAAVAMEQRARAAGKASAAAVYRAYINANKRSDEQQQLDEKCWTGYAQQGVKKKGDRMVPNCVRVSEDHTPDHTTAMSLAQDLNTMMADVEEIRHAGEASTNMNYLRELQRRIGVTQKQIRNLGFKYDVNHPDLVRPLGRPLAEIETDLEEAMDPFLDNAARELLALAFMAGIPFAIAAYQRVRNSLDRYRGQQIIQALIKRGVKMDRETYLETRPILDEFEDAVEANDGARASALAQRIEQMIVMGKLREKEPQAADDALAARERELQENLKQWFKQKWVRFGPDGKIRGDCARGSSKEGKPKCLPQAKAQALGKKGRASAAAKKRREDPDAERRGAAKNVATKVREAGSPAQQAAIAIAMKKAGKEPKSVTEGIPFDQCPGCGGAIVHISMLQEKQDACYHKVKSRYKVWPSAYASGALVQCRKKGAANWGTGAKKK